MLHLTGYDLSLEDLRQFRQWGSRTPGHPEAGHTAGIDVTTGPLGQGVRRRGGHGDRRALAADHVRQRGLRPPHLRHRGRRLLHGGDLARGGVAGGAPRPRAAARLLRRQPHHHRRADRAGLQRRPGRALRGLRLARAQPRRDGQRRRRPGGRHPGGARRAGGRARRQADAARAAQPHRLALPEADRHGRRRTARPSAPRRSRSPRRSWASPPDQTFWIPDEVREFYGQQIAAGRRAPRRLERALRGLEGRPRRLGRRAGRARVAGLGRRPARASRPAPSWPPATPSTSASTPRRPSCPACWPARPT